MEEESSILLDVVKSNGYEKSGYGYKKITEENTHWITLFGSGGAQLYAYFTEDPDMNDAYNTQVLNKVSPEELQTLINVLVSNNL
jgi:S-adenosylmethionine:diacylglycerol 3-amino-3-carboxypropyl transferase